MFTYGTISFKMQRHNNSTPISTFHFSVVSENFVRKFRLKKEQLMKRWYDVVGILSLSLSLSFIYSEIFMMIDVPTTCVSENLYVVTQHQRPTAMFVCVYFLVFSVFFV
jgi:hypothetical protein